MISEREKEILRLALKSKWIDDERLKEMGYYPSEIAEIKDEKKWMTVCLNVNFNEYKKTMGIITYVLGPDWTRDYDHKIERKRGKYEVALCINDVEYVKLQNKYRKGD